MGWLVNFLTSSIGRKLTMSLTGLFLSLFLVIHLVGNLQLFIDDQGIAFNAYAEFMSHNKLIKVASILTMATILLHAIQGILLYLKNKAARGQGYKVQNKKSSSWSSRNMAFLGTVILVFIITHLSNFWYKMKFGSIPIDAEGNKDLYAVVSEAFSSELLVGLYVLSMAAISYHLIHGFESGFQTLGLNHKKYAPVIKFLSIGVFGILIPLLYAAMPVYFYIMGM
jgi:succinate dehydrogenase / fumarate reductase cytochrome b subunit